MYKIFNDTKNKKALTLVELIIVITILLILATIGFLNFGNYGSQARDSLRKSDLKNIEKSINLYKTEKGSYPGVSLKENGEGEFGEEQFIEVKKLSELPKDPLTKNNYKYTLSEDKKIYKLEADLEDGKKFILTNGIIQNSNQENNKNDNDKEKPLNDDGTCSDGYLKFDGKCKKPGKMVLVYKGIKSGDTIELGFKFDTVLTKIDWGDDGINNCINKFEGVINSDNIKSYDGLVKCVYNNASKSDYTIIVEGLSLGYGTIHRGKNNYRNAKGIEKLEKVLEWTDMGMQNLQGGFLGASNLVSLPNNLDVGNVTTFTAMFMNASKFNQDISNWNMSKATDIGAMFNGASSFNQPLNSWDVSNVTNMNGLFFSATKFNQPLNNWNTSKVTNMSWMFYHAYNFNGDIGTWNTSKVTDMSGMFILAESFNKPIGNWDVSNVTNMYGMFNRAWTFNQPLNSWNVSKVKNMDYMFFMDVHFYQDISSWDVRGVPKMPSNFQHWGTRFREHHREETNGYNNDYLPELWKIKN